MDDAASAASRPRRRRPLRVLALVLAIAFALFVLSLEIGSRAADQIVGARKSAPGFDPKPHQQDLLDRISLANLDPAAFRLSDLRTIPHPYLAYALKPSWSTPLGSAQQCSHNSLGLRGKQTTWEKPPGVFRIVTSGGSSVYGQSETCDAAVWSQRLEDRLNDARPGCRVEVLNGGVSGYASFESLVQFQTRLADLRPDLLIHYEAINDMRCALYTRGGPIARDNTHWRQPWPIDRPSPLERLLERSRTYLFLRSKLTNYARLRPDLGYWAVVNYDPHGDPYDPEPVPDVGFDSYRRNLLLLIATARAHGCAVLLVTQPLARYHLDGAPSQAKQFAGIDRIHAIQREVGREQGVPVFELARLVEPLVQAELEREVERQRGIGPGAPQEELLRRAKGALHPRPLPAVPLENVIFRHEVHPYDFGSDLIAAKIGEHLLASGLLPECRR